jgi:CHASE3 domain sensor protein
MHRGFLWFLPAILIVLTLSVLGHVTLFEQWKAHYDKQLRRAKIIEEVLRLERLVVDVETSFRGYLLAGQRSFLEPLQAADGRLTSISDRLITLTALDPGLRAGVDVLRSRLKEFISSKNSLTAIADSGQKDQVNLYVRVGDGRALFLTIEKAFKDFENRIDREIPGDDPGTESWAARAGWQLLFLDAAGIFAGVALSRAFLRPAREPSHPFVTEPYKQTLK